jgi:hypothetical protein
MAAEVAAEHATTAGAAAAVRDRRLRGAACAAARMMLLQTGCHSGCEIAASTMELRAGAEMQRRARTQAVRVRLTRGIMSSSSSLTGRAPGRDTPLAAMGRSLQDPNQGGKRGRRRQCPCRASCRTQHAETSPRPKSTEPKRHHKKEGEARSGRNGHTTTAQARRESPTTKAHASRARRGQGRAHRTQARGHTTLHGQAPSRRARKPLVTQQAAPKAAATAAGWANSLTPCRACSCPCAAGQHRGRPGAQCPSPPLLTQPPHPQHAGPPRRYCCCPPPPPHVCGAW